jgi:xanthine dehydrogenase accessory factor
MNDARLRQWAERWLGEARAAVLVEVLRTQGSTPREAGTRMLVAADQAAGTIGGGHLEWQAIELARQALAEQTRPLARWEQTVALGPSLGQCCGGTVTLGFAPLDQAALATWPSSASPLHIELHGAGHVGQAIIRLLSDIDCQVRWIDTRPTEDNWPGMPEPAMLAKLPAHIEWVPTDDAAGEVQHAPPQACHLVLTHRHDLDLQIIEAVLRRSDTRLAGLIGSGTKRARFMHRLQERGLTPIQLNRLTCPIGLPGITGKAPATIAIAVVAQLLLGLSSIQTSDT